MLFCGTQQRYLISFPMMSPPKISLTSCIVIRFGTKLQDRNSSSTPESPRQTTPSPSKPKGRVHRCAPLRFSPWSTSPCHASRWVPYNAPPTTYGQKRLTQDPAQSIFSTSLPNWSPGDGESVVSRYIWVFVGLSLGLTAVTILAWHFTTNRDKKRKGERKDIQLEDIV
jgi:hypothetical protein